MAPNRACQGPPRWVSVVGEYLCPPPTALYPVDEPGNQPDAQGYHQQAEEHPAGQHRSGHVCRVALAQATLAKAVSGASGQEVDQYRRWDDGQDKGGEDQEPADGLQETDHVASLGEIVTLERAGVRALRAQSSSSWAANIES